jgi:hypothetical protein
LGSGRLARRERPDERGRLVCRSIKTLRSVEAPATEEEIRAAALQFVRKVSGYRQPSRANAPAFENAVEAVVDATSELLSAVTTPSNRAARPPEPNSARQSLAMTGQGMTESS